MGNCWTTSEVSGSKLQGRVANNSSATFGVAAILSAILGLSKAVGVTTLGAVACQNIIARTSHGRALRARAHAIAPREDEGRPSLSDSLQAFPHLLRGAITHVAMARCRWRGGEGSQDVVAVKRLPLATLWGSTPLGVREQSTECRAALEDERRLSFRRRNRRMRRRHERTPTHTHTPDALERDKEARRPLADCNPTVETPVTQTTPSPGVTPKSE